MFNNKKNQQLFKIKHNGECHRVRGVIHSYVDLLEVVNKRCEVTAFTLEYKDSDGDFVRINCEEDFQVLLEDFAGRKDFIKVFVRDSSEQSEQKPVEETQPEMVEEAQPEQLQMDVEKSDSNEQTSSEDEKMHKKWKKMGWKKKRQWMKKKFQKNLDKSIQNAIPQIANEVAQILGKRPANHNLPSDNEDQKVHYGFIYNDQGVTPIKVMSEEGQEPFTGGPHKIWKMEHDGKNICRMLKHGKKMFHKMMGGKKMWCKKRRFMKKMWTNQMEQNGQEGGCPMKFFKKMMHGGKGKGGCGKWMQWKKENPNFDWKNMSPEKKFWFKMMKNRKMFFRMMKNEEFFNKMMTKFNIDPKQSPELMKILEQKKQFWMNFQKEKKDFDWKNMSPEKAFWCKVMMKKKLFWRMMKNERFFNKQMEEHNIDPKNAPELMRILKEKKQWMKQMKGCKKGWRRGPGRRGPHGCHPMRKFFRMMMGGRPHGGPFGGPHRGPHGGPFGGPHRGPHGHGGRRHGGRRHGGRRHGGRRHGGRRHGHGHGKFWRKHGQMNQMSYEDQLQEALQRSLGLKDQTVEQTKDEVIIQEEPEVQQMYEDKRVSSTSESSSNSESSDTPSDSTSSDSETPEEKVDQVNPMQQLAQMAQNFMPMLNQSQGNQQNQPDLGNLIQQGIQMFTQNMNNQNNQEVSEEDAVQEAIKASLQDALHQDKKQKVDEDSEDLYDDGNNKTEGITEDKPKVVQCTLDIDAVAMENTKQICSVFGVPEDQTENVYKWVKAKKTNAVNELLNLFIDEMAGSF